MIRFSLIPISTLFLLTLTSFQLKEQRLFTEQEDEQQSQGISEIDFSETHSLLTKVTKSFLRDNIWKEYYQYELTYDTLLRVNGALETDSNNVRTRISYHYDQEGRVVDNRGERWFDSAGAWVLTTTLSYQYNNKGYTTNSTRRVWRSSQQTDGSRQEFQYDDLGRMNARIAKKWIEGEWINDYQTTYIKTDNHSVEEQLEKHWEHEGWIPTYRTITEHDPASGIETVRQISLFPHEPKVTALRYVTTTTPSNRKTEKIMQDSIWDQWTDMFRTIATSDEDGNVIEEVDQHKPYKTLPWESWQRMIFTYRKAQLRLPKTLANPIQKPSGFKLFNNFPNPFNSTTQIRYTVAHPAFVSIKVYDILGRAVETLVSDTRESGDYFVTWGANGVSSGIYFFRMESNGFSQIRKMMLLK